MIMPNIGISNRLIPNTVTAIMITLKMRTGKSFLVAGPGFEPGTKAYETYMMPFQHPAIVILHDHQLSVNLRCIAVGFTTNDVGGLEVQHL